MESKGDNEKDKDKQNQVTTLAEGSDKRENKDTKRDNNCLLPKSGARTPGQVLRIPLIVCCSPRPICGFCGGPHPKNFPSDLTHPLFHKVARKCSRVYTKIASNIA